MPTPSQSLVSVIIPTYNRAAVIPPTLESVLAQTHPQVEIIVVDDGSTDNTAAVIASYGDRVRYVRQDNQGVERARSRGIRVSTGDYLTFLDDDDLMHPRKLELQAAMLDEQAKLGAVHCQYHFIDKDGVLMETSGQMPQGDVRHPLAYGCFPWSGGPLIRRECFDHIGEDEHRDWYGDWGMWLRIALAGYEFGCVQQPLGDYRIVAGSMTDDKVGNAERLVLNILGEIFSRWELPPQTIAEKNLIYAGWHFWISCRYYLGGYWQEGGRNLEQVIAYWPEVKHKPDDLLQRFYWDAISPRVRVQDPIRFINDVFDHLPESASFLAAHRGKLLGQLYAGLALRSCRAGALEAGREQFAQAVQHHPALIGDADALLNLVRDYAASQMAILPENYLEIVFENLPAQVQALPRLRQRVVSELNISRAFHNFQSGKRQQVSRQVLTAVRYNRELLKNRGVLAILVKSLPSLVLKDR